MCGRALTSNYGHSKPIVFISIVFNFARLIFAYLWLLRFTCSPSFILCSSVQSFTLHWFLFACLFALLFFSIIIIFFCFLSNGFAMHTNTRSYINMKIKCIRNSLPHTKRATFLLLSNGNVFVSSCAQIQCDRVQSRLRKKSKLAARFRCVCVCARVRF